MIGIIVPSNHNSQSRKMNFAMYWIVADIRCSCYAVIVLSLETTVERFVIKPSQHDMDSAVVVVVVVLLLLFLTSTSASRRA